MLQTTWALSLPHKRKARKRAKRQLKPQLLLQQIRTKTLMQHKQLHQRMKSNKVLVKKLNKIKHQVQQQPKPTMLLKTLMRKLRPTLWSKKNSNLNSKTRKNQRTLRRLVKLRKLMIKVGTWVEISTKTNQKRRSNHQQHLEVKEEVEPVRSTSVQENPPSCAPIRE